MRWRIIAVIVLVVVLGAGAAYGRPFLQGYLGARQAVVPPAPVQPVDNQPVAPPVSAPAKETKQQTTKPTVQPVQSPPKSESQAKPSPPPVPANGAPVGESKIDKEYLAQLNQIGQYYQEQLNKMLSQAYQNYLAVKEGKSQVSLLTLAGEYMKQGEALQKQSDSQFYGVLDQYRAALQKAGLPTTYEEQAKTEYDSAKTAERQKILSAAEKYLK